MWQVAGVLNLVTSCRGLAAGAVLAIAVPACTWLAQHGLGSRQAGRQLEQVTKAKLGMAGALNWLGWCPPGRHASSPVHGAHKDLLILAF